MEGEQTWPTQEELDEAEGESITIRGVGGESVTTGGVHSGLVEQCASEHARLWLHWLQHSFMCHHLPYMVKQCSTSQKYNHPLASST